MTLRKVPGALALGLLASLIAHGGLYGGEHAMGGGYHAMLVQGSLAGAMSLLLCFGFLALRQVKDAANGSILAARLTQRLPGYGSLVLSAGAWYAAAECLEPHHAAASFIAVPLLLAAASWLVKLLCVGMLAALAGAIFAVFGAAFAPRKPLWFARARSRRPARRIQWTRRRFARPPPIGLDCCA